MLGRVCSLIKMGKPLRNRGLLWASGTVVPVDGTDGYQKACVFLHTDGDTEDLVYINEGSVTSSNFQAGGGGDETIADLADVADSFATRLLETGTYANTAASGVLLSLTNTRPMAVLSDDGGADLVGGNYRPLLSRTLLTIDQTGSTITPVRGQLKLNNLIDVATGIYAPVQGYIEVAGTSIASSGATLSCISASLEITTALTAASGGEVAGIHVETTGAGTLTATGTVAGILIDKASGAADWPVGISVLNSTTAVSIGASTTGVLLSGAITTGISITSTSTTDGIKISGVTPVDGVEVSSACSAAAFHVSGASAVGLLVAGACTTAAVHVTGDQVIGLLFDVDESATDGIKMSVDTTKTLTDGIEMSGAGTITTGLLMNPTTLVTGVSIGACTTGVLIGGGAVTTGISITATSLTDGIKISGVTPVDGVEVSGACSAAAFHASGASAAGVLVSGVCTTAAFQSSTTSAVGLLVSGASTTAAVHVSAGWGEGYNTAGILIAADAAGTVLALGATTAGYQGLYMNLSATVTGGENLHGIYTKLTTAGAMADGYIIGHYSRVTLAHKSLENYAMWGRMIVTAAQGGDTSNQFIGVFGTCAMSGETHALLATGGCYGVYGVASIASGGTLDQPLLGGYFECNAVDNIAGLTCASRHRMIGYTDYGIDVLCQSNNNVAAIRVAPEQSAIVAVGISFEVSAGSGKINHVLKFEDSTNCGVNTSGNVGAAQESDAIIKIDIAGTDYYLPAYLDGSVTGEWADA